jgi:hypothetical protein
MLLQLYGLASLLVFALAIGPFLRDRANPKTDWHAWFFLALAVAFSPITLPNMLWRGLHRQTAKKSSTSPLLSQLP